MTNLRGVKKLSAPGGRNIAFAIRGSCRPSSTPVLAIAASWDAKGTDTVSPIGRTHHPMGRAISHSIATTSSLQSKGWKQVRRHSEATTKLFRKFSVKYFPLIVPEDCAPFCFGKLGSERRDSARR